MFSVYGASGRLFRGTLEELRQVRPVHAVDRARAIEPAVRDGSDSALREALASPARPPVEPHRVALAAYEQTRHPARQRWSEAPVSSIMQRVVFTLAQGATVGEAWALLDQHGIGQAPVVGVGGILVGLATRVGVTGLARLPAHHGNQHDWDALLGEPIVAVMHTPVSSVHADTDLRHVATALLEAHLPGLPVVDEHGLVTGFVTGSDILRAALHDAAVDLWS